MALKNYYELLELEASASAEDVKRAFRLQIARYHPDKVQHLGREFQAMAAARAAELTEAYRVLSDAARRVEYDRAREAELSRGAAPNPPAPASPPTEEPSPAKAVKPETDAPAQPPPPPPQPSTGQFVQERAVRDEFVRKATLLRFKQALVATMGNGYQEAQLPGFEFAWQPKTGLFSRGKGPRLVGRFLMHVDADAVADAWTQARKWAGDGIVCVFLIAPSLAPQADLAAAIAEQRRRARAAKVTVIPIDALDWAAHVPVDAPALAKNLIARLRSGT